MKVRFHPEAKQEHAEAFLFYLRANRDIARAFARQTKAAVEAVRQNPTPFPFAERDVRRCLVKQFPYGIFYTLEAHEIVSWAVRHLKRRPGYWKECRQ